MKKLLLLPALFIMITCKKDGIKKSTPDCVKLRIDEYTTSAPCDDAKVKEYLFQRKTVYVFEAGSCGADMTSTVINEQCNVLGHLGGVTGNTEINGEDFSNAKYKGTTWEKK